MNTYYEKLPKKRMGAGALMFNDAGDVLLVKTTYGHWEIPGGVVELNESPKDACRREIQEELSLQREVGRLLCVDYGAEKKEKSESLQFVFDGGVLTQQQLEEIRLNENEISEYRFCDPREISQWLPGSLGKRVEQALKYKDNGEDAYFQH